jgi:hypothetical protein
VFQHSTAECEKFYEKSVGLAVFEISCFGSSDTE